MLKDYWMEFLIAAYAIVSIDVILTARGILVEGLHEGNALVTALFPNHNPLQVPLIALFVMSAFWTMFYFCSKPNFEKHGLISFLLLVGCATHTFGITTWIVR